LIKHARIPTHIDQMQPILRSKQKSQNKDISKYWYQPL